VLCDVNFVQFFFASSNKTYYETFAVLSKKIKKSLSFCFEFQGIACSGFTFYVQLWCTQKKGPVFVTMFDPLAAIMAAMLAYFMFGENLYIGRYII
jgi:hypothetical protein